MVAILPTTTGPTDGFAGWVVDLMGHLGAVGAGVAIALENVFPPLPSEAVLPLAGFTASTGEVSLVAVLVWTTLGSLVGATVLYGLGRWLGQDRLRGAAARIPLVDPDEIDRADAWFARHGDAAVLLLSSSAVEKHVAAVFGKLGLGGDPAYSKRVLAVLRYLGR